MVIKRVCACDHHVVIKRGDNTWVCVWSPRGHKTCVCVWSPRGDKTTGDKPPCLWPPDKTTVVYHRGVCAGFICIFCIRWKWKPLSCMMIVSYENLSGKCKFCSENVCGGGHNINVSFLSLFFAFLREEREWIRWNDLSILKTWEIKIMWNGMYNDNYLRN